MNTLFSEGQHGGANFSRCRNYRYTLFRKWDHDMPLVMFIGLNPSTANELEDDPTIQSVTRITAHNGYGGFYMMNCWPIISPDPAVLLSQFGHIDHEHHIAHNEFLLGEVAKMCKNVVFAWGNFNIVRKTKRDQALMEKFPRALCIGHNANGSPKHPLFQKGNSTLKLYNYNSTIERATSC